MTAKASGRHLIYDFEALLPGTRVQPDSHGGADVVIRQWELIIGIFQHPEQPLCAYKEVRGSRSGVLRTVVFRAG
ncbi:hypothetical protein ACK9YZ_02100 [Rhizobium sp. ZK1]|uniref:hypothetical protein n=1 Tax=Rhizobium sp. ZK1 TaxID=3389872 RepID=UPI0039F6AB94